MTRREVAGCLLVVLLVVAGRGIRHALLVDPSGGWREPGWLEATLPPEAPPLPPAAAARQRPSGRLNPNTCPVDSLVLLPGIGPALAARIAAARAEGVHFACARDLQAIRGIGPRTVERLAPYLIFSPPDSGR
ncbi:MAG TPA: helix-hairpin-helix domain-containing protein [Candidatus Krumholzibacteria bacterium]|nr:helix-hairpin-helix domain-containing protein [Candidatus Krumholzibacteria bacterium]HPD71454.1 helix-hairpin-helix domain-containing protein [Candidatus Krumholzibacteria bacterium]HRY41613.1 helix-hairpin-helix domain-containing protein [Candidatus Krumholzibacteria bacterium]